MPRNSKFSHELSTLDLDFIVEGTFYPGRPGRVSGPPENCIPDEPDEIDIEKVTLAILPDVDILGIISEQALDTIYAATEEKIAADILDTLEDYPDPDWDIPE